MPLDTSSLPVSGSFLLACALYAGASIYAGQEMATRMIDKSDWEAVCAEGVKAAARPAPRVQSRIPERRCSDVTAWLPPELRRLCDVVGNPDINGPARRVEQQAEEQRRAIERARVKRAAASAPTRCSCAANVYKSDKMIALGVYAGSARQITLSGVEDLRIGLKQGLAAPQCQALAP